MSAGVAAILGIYGLMSMVAFAAYRVDKRRAERGEWRVSETTLHGIELLGGWPGAWAGQHVFRHKRQKRGYMIVFRVIVVAHAVAWAWWLSAYR